MANPTEQELKDAYGDDYSQINYESDNVLRTDQSEETDFRTLLSGRTEGARLLKPQKKISLTKKDKEDAGRPLDIAN